MDTIVKKPSECTSAELDTFQQLVVEGGEVTPYGLRQRIEQAAVLIFINENDCVAIGGIKNPDKDYKDGVFSKAGVSIKSGNYNFELGWLYVTPAARKNGLGHNLMQAIASHLGDSGCYATTRENNSTMRHLFPKYGFSMLGTPYPSEKKYTLVLYANNLRDTSLHFT